jgi:hypothetical protein
MAQQPTVWYEVTYLKVLPANADAYVKSETDIKPVHQDRVAKLQILGWALYSVRFAGTKSEYNYVRVTEFSDYAKIGNDPFTDEQRKRITDLRGVGRNALRDLVKTDILGQFASAGRMNAPWIEVNFIKSKPGIEQDVRGDETKLYKPIRDAELKAGGKGRKGWAAAFVRWPTGANVEYDIVAADAFDTFGAFGSDNNAGFEAQTAEARRNGALHSVAVKRELLQLIASTDPAK